MDAILLGFYRDLHYLESTVQNLNDTVLMSHVKKSHLCSTPSLFYLLQLFDDKQAH